MRKELKDLKELLKDEISINEKQLVLECLDVILDEEELRNELIVVTSRYNAFLEDQIKNINSKENSTIENNQITDSLLKLIDTLNSENTKENKTKTVTALLNRKKRRTKRYGILALLSTLIFGGLMFWAGMYWIEIENQKIVEERDFLKTKLVSTQDKLDLTKFGLDSVDQILKTMDLSENEKNYLIDSLRTMYKECEDKPIPQSNNQEINSLNNSLATVRATLATKEQSLIQAQQTLHVRDQDLQNCRAQIPSLPTGKVKIWCKSSSWENNQKIRNIKTALENKGIQVSRNPLASVANKRKTIEYKADHMNSRKFAFRVLELLNIDYDLVVANQLNNNNEVHIYFD